MANADVFLPPGPSTHKQGKPVNSKQQNIIFNVVNYFVEENENRGNLCIGHTRLCPRQLQQWDLAQTYIKKLAKEGKAGRTSGKNRHQRKGKFGKLDDFNVDVIRQIIHCFYLRNESSSPTIWQNFGRA